MVWVPRQLLVYAWRPLALSFAAEGFVIVSSLCCFYAKNKYLKWNENEKVTWKTIPNRWQQSGNYNCLNVFAFVGGTIRSRWRAERNLARDVTASADCMLTIAEEQSAPLSYIYINFATTKRSKARRTVSFLVANKMMSTTARPGPCSQLKINYTLGYVIWIAGSNPDDATYSWLLVTLSKLFTRILLRPSPSYGCMALGPAERMLPICEFA